MNIVKVLAATLNKLNPNLVEKLSWGIQNIPYLTEEELQQIEAAHKAAQFEVSSANMYGINPDTFYQLYYVRRIYAGH